MPEEYVPALAGLVALLLVGHAGVWRVTRTVVTIAHEGGHAAVAVLTGRRLSGIRVHTDTSGVTVSVGRARGPGMVCTALAGYPAPSLLGLVAAGLVAAGATRVLLGLAVAFLLVTLVWVRNWFGGVAVLLTGTLVGLVAWYGTPGLRRGFCAVAAWFLLLGGLAAVRELVRARHWQRRRGARYPDSDADQLARLTRLPAGLWLAVFVLVGLGALALGGWWLLGDLLAGPLAGALSRAA